MATALCAVLVALAGLALLAVRSTRDATEGANRIESEFGERVKSGAALTSALTNYSIAQERLRVTSAGEARRQGIELADSDARLGQRIAAALNDSNREVAEEARAAASIRRAYRRYLAERDRLLAARADGASAESLNGRFDAAFEPLRAGLQGYADVHFQEAQGQLLELRRTGQARNLVLAGVLLFGLISLLAVIAVARGIVRRVRDYASFAGLVADGDLAARLEPGRTDELSTLAESLNAMVEQLSATSRQRKESTAQETAYAVSPGAGWWCSTRTTARTGSRRPLPSPRAHR